MEYKIFEDNMPKLEKKLATIQKKCAKYGTPFEYKVVGEDYQEHEDEILRYVIVDVTGKAIINDWQFIASIEHTEDGNIIKCVDSSVTVPERYRTSDGYCEHCHTKRKRKNTCIVMNTKTGEFKQLGRQCVRDYTSGLSAEYIAQYIADKLKVSISAVSSYLPYTKGQYLADEPTENAIRIRQCRQKGTSHD